MHTHLESITLREHTCTSATCNAPLGCAQSELTMKLSNEGGVFSPEETAHKILEDTLVRPHLLLLIHNPQSTVHSPASLPFPSPCHHISLISYISAQYE